MNRIVHVIVGGLLLMLTHCPSSSLAECTSFYLSAEQGHFFATNYDYPNELENGLIFVNQRGIAKRRWCSPLLDAPKGDGKTPDWVSEYGSLTFNLAGYQLVWAGINEHGLTVSTMYLKETETSTASGKPVLDGCLWLQFLLDTCKDVDEVVRTGGKFAVDTQQHYLIGDGRGNYAVVEFLDGTMCIHRGRNAPVAALTNSTYKRSLEAWSSKKVPVNDPYTTLARFCIAAKCASEFGATDDDPTKYAFGALDDAKQDETQWSIVFDIDAREVKFKTRSHPQLRSIDLKKLDFSQHSPTMMHQVQTPLERDITDHLFAYSHDVSFAHTYRFFDAYLRKQGIEWPQDRIRALAGNALDDFEQFRPVESN